MWVRVAFSIALLLLPSAVFGQTEKRIALLIGNKDYQPGVGSLTNPLNDIRIVGDALRAIGFEVLKPTQNATRAAMLRAILEFTAKLKAAGPDAVGFLYYSGHGIASAGENYLIPVDVEVPSTVELSVQGVKHSEVLAILRGEAPNAAHYLVLDACRNTLQGARGGKGFIPVGQQSGVLVAFATEPGKTASDTGQSSGPYAAALAAELVKPSQNDLLMFHNVRDAVMDKTNGDQAPWTEDGIQRRQRVLFGRESTIIPAPTVPPPPISQTTEVERAWALVKDTTDIAALEAFRSQYAPSAVTRSLGGGNALFARLAEARIEELQRQKTLAPIPSTPMRKGQPLTTGMLGCETYLTPTTCEWNKSCAWVEGGKRCERKEGSLSTSLLEALPSKQASETPCVGVETLVGNEKRCLKPGDSFKDCPECPEMVVVRTGGFMMGSRRAEEGHASEEDPVHMVSLAKPFAVGKFEATFAEWDACLAAGGCRHKPSDEGWGRGKNPVINVSWEDITTEFLPWLSRISRRTYRLLTEAEWEYAARAGTLVPFSTGSWITTKQANFDGNYTYGGSAKRELRRRAVEVGSFKANDFGLHDMHGNVREWVEDCWHENYQGAPTDGSAWTTGQCNDRVLRGGSWTDSPSDLRSSSRMKYSPVGRDTNFGFRLATTLSP